MTHPEVLEKFLAGMFTVQKKTKRIFSSIATGQALEQNNACTKEDGGAVGLINQPNALQNWMVAGPEVARVIGEFETVQEQHDSKAQTLHHDQTERIQKSFEIDVRSLVSFIEELGNPFLRETTDIVVINIANDIACSPLLTLCKRWRRSLWNYSCKKGSLSVKRPLNNVLSRNKLPLFGGSSPNAQSKDKQKVASFKCDVQLFSRLDIACQTREANLDDLFPS